MGANAGESGSPPAACKTGPHEGVGKVGFGEEVAMYEDAAMDEEDIELHASAEKVPAGTKGTANGDRLRLCKGGVQMPSELSAKTRLVTDDGKVPRFSNDSNNGRCASPRAAELGEGSAPLGPNVRNELATAPGHGSAALG